MRRVSAFRLASRRHSRAAECRARPTKSHDRVRAPFNDQGRPLPLTTQSRTADVENDVDADSCTVLFNTTAAPTAITIATAHATTNIRIALLLHLLTCLPLFVRYLLPMSHGSQATPHETQSRPARAGLRFWEHRMASKPSFDRPKSSKQIRTGFEKMQMSHLRTQKQIERIKVENAERTATGKPVHAGRPSRA